MIVADGPVPHAEPGQVVRPASHEIFKTEVVRDFLPLEARYRCRHLPVILLLGTHGSDKSVLLEAIRDSYAEHIPSVLRDLNENHHLRPHEVAISLAYGLSAKVEGFGRLRFPRLILGLIVVHERINQHNRAAAEADIKRALKTRSSMLGRATAIIRTMLSGLVSDKELRAVLTLALLALEAIPGIQSYRILRSRPARWYLGAPGLRSTRAVDALIELNWLNRRAAKNTPAARDQVDEVLCAAFLADLRAGFGGGLRLWQRNESCLALLDNADSSTGEAFIQTLATVRQRRHRGAPEQDGDPLVVLAAGHTRFPEFAHEQGSYPRIRAPEEASHAEWSGSLGHRHRLASWLYPVGLGDLSTGGNGHTDLDELNALAQQWLEALEVGHTVAFVRQLTAGHLWSSRLVLRGISAATLRRTPVDLRGVLDWPDPDQPKRTLAEGAAARLLRGEPAELREDLISLAAAEDVTSRSCRAALGEEASEKRVQRLEGFCAADLWVLFDDPPRLHWPGDPRRLHWFLRRVLLHRLARRDFAHDHCWLAVHDRLRRHHQDEHPDPVLHAHHALALGDPVPGLRHLSAGFASAERQEWLKQLYAIARAPRLVEPRTEEAANQTPQDEADELTSAAITQMDAWASEALADPEALASLLVEVRISIDPLGDPARTLDARISDAFRTLAKRGLRGRDVLLDEATRYLLHGPPGRFLAP